MSNRAIVLDLDDTLIDTKGRHFRIVDDFIKQQNPSFSHTLQSYLDFRKNGKNNLLYVESIFGNSIISDRFSEFWTENIESKNYLELDTRIVDFHLLNTVRKTHDLILCSLRSKIHAGVAQLKYLGLADYFKEICFVKHLSESNPKIESLKKIKSKYASLIFIGDSYSDFEAAQIARVEFSFVSTGIYAVSNSKVEKYKNVNVLLNSLK